MSNKAKLILFLVFAALTFYQFYTYAKTFDLMALLPRDTSGPNIVYGIGYQDVAVSPSAARFDPSLLLLALNIALWVERPDRIKRAPLILAFIANLSIVIMSVGIAAPALKLAAAAPQNDIQTIWNLASLHAEWNAVYLIPATISSIVALGLLIQLYSSDHAITSARILFSKITGQFGRKTSLPKAKIALLLIFALLTFYQFYMYANLLDTRALFPPNTPEPITIPTSVQGTYSLDVRVSFSPPRFDFALSFLLLALNIVLWIKQPDQFERRPLISALIANLAIVIIHVIITSPVFNLAPAPREYIRNIWVIRNFYAKWNFVYLIAATISSLMALIMLVPVLRKRSSS